MQHLEGQVGFLSKNHNATTQTPAPEATAPAAEEQDGIAQQPCSGVKIVSTTAIGQGVGGTTPAFTCLIRRRS